jgi:hypothetical protein
MLRVRICISVLVAVACVCLGVVRAEDDPRLRTDIDKELAERLYRESLARQGCKTAICDAARKKDAEGGNIACKVLKTWPAVDLKEKILKGKLDWPWGNAQCEASFSVSRDVIIAAMVQPKFEAKVGKHHIECHLEAKAGKEAQTIEFTIDPVVNFENGKAVKAALHWGDVGGSTAAKSALWSATALDNALNMLQGALLEQINEFFGAKCDAAASKP